MQRRTLLITAALSCLTVFQVCANSESLSIALLKAITNDNYSAAEKLIEYGARITIPEQMAEAVDLLGYDIITGEQQRALLYIRALDKDAFAMLYRPLICDVEGFCWRLPAISLLELAERAEDSPLIDALKASGATLTTDEMHARARKSFYKVLCAEGCNAALARVEEGIKPLISYTHEGLKQLFGLHHKCGSDFLKRLFELTNFNRTMTLEYMAGAHYNNEEIAIILSAGDDLPGVDTLRSILHQQMSEGIFDLALLAQAPLAAIPDNAVQQALLARRLDVIEFLIKKGARLDASYPCPDDLVAEAIRRNLKDAASLLLHSQAPVTSAALNELYRLQPEEAKQLLIELLQKGVEVSSTALVNAIKLPAPYAQEFFQLLIAARNNKVDDLTSYEKAQLITWAIMYDQVLFEKLVALDMSAAEA